MTLPSSQPKNFLGIDWGAKKIGLALAHAETRLALPLITLPNDASLFEKLGDLFTKEGVGTVILGVPKHSSYEKEEYPSQKFGKLLLEHFPVKLILVNEMFTTQLAQKKINERNEKVKKGEDDKEAARLLLQEWLDHKKSLV